MKNKIIYRHLKPCGEVFYIGIGKSEKRAYSKRYRNPHWHHIVDKYNYEVQILKSDLTWEEACELEIDLISFYGRRDLGTGTLVNLTDGGDGAVNLSDESKRKISLANKGNSHRKGKTHSEEAKLKISLARKGKPSNNKGNTYSEESKRKMSEAMKGRKLLGKTCLVLDTQTGVFYNSITEASFYYDIKRENLNAMLNGKRTNKTNLIKI